MDVFDWRLVVCQGYNERLCVSTGTAAVPAACGRLGGARDHREGRRQRVAAGQRSERRRSQ